MGYRYYDKMLNQGNAGNFNYDTTEQYSFGYGQSYTDFNLSNFTTAMNGMELREMDKIIDPVCTLCRDHEKAGFVAGVNVSILLQPELSEK